jgi:hypothetical protein
MPVAVISTVPFAARVRLAGETTIEARVAGVTLTVADPCMPLRVAVIEAFPTPRPVTRPTLVNASLTCAMELLAEVQLT